MLIQPLFYFPFTKFLPIFIFPFTYCKYIRITNENLSLQFIIFLYINPFTIFLTFLVKKSSATILFKICYIIFKFQGVLHNYKVSHLPIFIPSLYSPKSIRLSLLIKSNKNKPIEKLMQFQPLPLFDSIFIILSTTTNLNIFNYIFVI